MKYRYLGSSGLLVSRISLGTMTFGTPDWGCDENESHAIIKGYLEGGGIVGQPNFTSHVGNYVPPPAKPSTPW